MGNFAKNICIFFKKIIFDCYEKLCQKEIFFFDEPPTANIRFANREFSKLSKEEKFKIIESLDIIAAYNSDFGKLKMRYLRDKPVINLNSFKEFIQKEESGYYIKKAIFFLIIRFLFIVAQLLLTLILIYPKYECIYESIDENDENYWMNGNEKLKVKLIKINALFFIRIINAFFDFMFILFEVSVLCHLERRKFDKFYLIIVQIVRYALFWFIIILDIFQNDYCEHSENKNLFYKNNKENKFIQEISIISEIIKKFIN